MAGKDSEIQHIENDQIGRVDTADLSAAEKIDLQQAHTANTADLPALLADNISYGKSGVKGLVSSPYILGASFLASMGGFSFGYDQGVISIINVMPQFTAQYPQIGEDDPRSAFWKGLNTALLQLGCFMGCFFMPWLCDRISRKWAITVMVVFFNVGGIIMTAAPNYGTLAFGRWFSGLGTGTLALGAPLYISEIAPPNLRGTLLVLESISIVSGVVISFFITYGTRHMEGDISFRLPFGLQLVSSTILGLLIHIFPYSPRWLCLKGRNDEALAALCKLRRLPDTDERIQIEHAGIMAEVELQYAMQERAHPGKSGFRLELAQWGDLFRKKMWRRTVVGVGVAFFQQFSGINAFIYYAPTLFQSLGSDYEMSLILSGVMNVIQLVAVLLCFLIIDTLGRRPLAIYGAATACVCYIIIAGLVGSYSDDWSANTAAGWVCVAMAFSFMFFYGLSYSPLGWALPSEVYSTTTRAKGVALATATVWLCNFIVGLATPPMIEGAGFGTYIFFGGFCGLACVWAYLFVPETKGKTLEQMDEVFGDKSAQEEKELMKEAMRRGSKTGIAVAPGVMGGVPGEHDAKDFA